MEWYVIGAGVVGVLLLLGVFKPRVPKSTRNMLAILLLGLFVWQSGWLSGAGISTSAATVTDLQLGTPTGNCTIAADTSREDYYTARCTDAAMDQGATSIAFNALVTVFRDGADAEVVDIQAISPDFSSPSDSSDSNAYNVVEKSADGKLKVYFHTSDATTSTPQEVYKLGFTEGAASATLDIGIVWDEESLDELNAYDSKVVTVMIGNKPLYVEITDLDAAA